MRRWYVIALAALIFSGCVTVPAMKPVAEAPCVVAPMPKLPDVVSVPAKDCAYALCLDDENFARLRQKLAILESR